MGCDRRAFPAESTSQGTLNDDSNQLASELRNRLFNPLPR